MSILITVASLIFVSILPGQEAGDVNIKNSNNTKKLERVEEAMRSFMATNGRRPCPADGQYAVNTPYYGREAANPGACTGGTPTAPLGPDAGTGYVVGGVIPVTTLGLDESYMVDEFGHRFTYVVDKRATASWATAIGQSTTSICPVLEGLTGPNYVPTGSGGVVIENATGGTVIDNTMYAYISHGKSGYGAFPEQGSTVTGRINSGSNDTDMQTNAGVNSSFLYNTSNFTNVKVQKDAVAPTTGDTGFDDMLWYRQDLKNICCLGAACVQKGFQIPSNNLFYGAIVTSGDFNGDGIADLIITQWNSLGSSIYIIFGTKAGFPDPLPLTSTLNGTNGIAFKGPGSATSNSYEWVTAMGDVDGDGNADLVMGYGGADPVHGVTAPGAVYVIFGGPTRKDGTSWSSCTYASPCTLSGALVNGTNGAEFDGQPTLQAGASLAVGDINGDGKGDIIIGAPRAGGADASGTIAFSGNPTNGEYITLNGVQWTFVSSGATGNQTNIGATSNATVWQLENDLKASANGSLTVAGYSTSPASNSWLAITYKTVGTAGNSYTISAGTAPATASGATLANGYGSSSTYATGAVYVVYGVADGSWPASATFLNAAFLNGTNGFELDGVAGGNYTGGYIGGGNLQSFGLATGDFNGDGYADILIGAVGATMSVANGGAAYVVFGGPNVSGAPSTKGGTSWASITPALLNNTLLTGINGAEFDNFNNKNNGVGFSVAAGDINGDGIADVIIGAPSWPSGISYKGAVYIVWGKTGAWASSPTLLNAAFLNGTNGIELDDSFTGGAMGAALATGDINGDGMADLIIGADQINRSGYSAVGSVFVLFGGTTKHDGTSWASGTPYTVNSTLLNGIDGFELDGVGLLNGEGGSGDTGFSVAAGDINGDGIPDILISVERWSAAYIFFGHKNSINNPWPTTAYSLGGL